MVERRYSVSGPEGVFVCFKSAILAEEPWKKPKIKIKYHKVEPDCDTDAFWAEVSTSLIMAMWEFFKLGA